MGVPCAWAECHACRPQAARSFPHCAVCADFASVLFFMVFQMWFVFDLFHERPNKLKNRPGLKNHDTQHGRKVCAARPVGLAEEPRQGATKQPVCRTALKECTAHPAPGTVDGQNIRNVRVNRIRFSFPLSPFQCSEGRRDFGMMLRMVLSVRRPSSHLNQHCVWGTGGGRIVWNASDILSIYRLAPLFLFISLTILFQRLCFTLFP
jgi:hypothetical protein